MTSTDVRRIFHFQQLMPNRFFYQLALENFTPSRTQQVSVSPTIRQPGPDDLHALASLMLAAYSGTIDDDGGILEDAVNEVKNWLAGEYGDPLLSASRIALDNDGDALSAVLVSRWGEENLPLITFVMTVPSSQKSGLARSLMEQTLASLKETQETQVQALVTEGNISSERLFRSLGFTRIRIGTRAL